MAIEYNFSGKWDDYKELLRKFSLDSILKYVNIQSTKLCLGEGTKHSHKMISVPFTAKGSGVWEKRTVLITIWNLVDLSYYAVMATHDYRGIQLNNEDDFYMLCMANLNYMQTTEKNTIKPIAKDPAFLFYVNGFSGEQLKMQNPAYVFGNAARELYMLLELSKKIGDIDVEEIVRRKTGMEWIEITASILLVWVCLSRTMDIRKMERIVRWDNEYRVDTFRRIIDRYTTNYEEVRESNLGRQIFYTKPYIRTQKNELLSVNCYLDFCLYEHCILWIVRDYYMELDSQSFNIYFGKLFEGYFSELLSFCLIDDQYMKIEPDKNKKRADWKMELLGYRFLIEQKSSILRLTAKQQDSDYSATIEFTKRNIIKAIKQLEATEHDFSDGEYIKIVLLYEDYLSPSIIDLGFTLSECNVKNDNRYWLMTIDEMERFLYTYKTNPSLIQTIIDERMSDGNENAPSSIGFLLSKYGIDANEYLKQRKFEYYRDHTKEFVRAHLIQS